MSRPSRFASFAMGGIIAVSSWLLGCSPSEHPPSQRRPPAIARTPNRATGPNVTLTGGVSDRVPGRNIRDVAANAMTPKEVLAAVLDRYHRATHYHDRGRLVAQYRSGDTNRVAEAPMSVTLREDAFAVVAYEARLVMRNQQIWGWIEDPTRPQFADQVLRSRAPAGRPTDRVLTSDPLLTSAIAAGVAGPPPQLEWLFAEEPMKSLLDDSRIRVGRSRTIDDTACRAFEATTGSETFRFWIDERSEIIRRVEFPRVPMERVGTEPSEASDGIAMTLYLDDATFSTRVEASHAFSRKPPADAVAVKRLVQPPSDIATAVGQNLTRALDPRDQTKALQWMFRSDQSGLGVWLDSLRQQAERSDVIESVDRLRIHQWPARETDRDADNKTSNWTMHPSLRDLPQTRSVRLSPETLWVVDSSGKVHFEQPLQVPVDPTLLMAVTADLAAGVDVAKRIRTAEAEDRKRYDTQLDRVRWR